MITRKMNYLKTSLTLKTTNKKIKVSMQENIIIIIIILAPPIQDEDPYGGSTDEGSDMETGPPGKQHC